MMQLRTMIVVLIVALGFGSAPADSEARANQWNEIGWVLSFDLAHYSDVQTGNFYFELTSQTNPASDVTGTVSIQCSQDLSAPIVQCAIPDMAALILDASQGQVNIRQMSVPLGQLDVCGTLVVADRMPPYTLVTTDKSDLYELGLQENQLRLLHGKYMTSSPIDAAFGQFHLMLPKTTLTAPESYTLTINLPEQAKLQSLTIVDPGAFTHLHGDCE